VRLIGTIQGYAGSNRFIECLVNDSSGRLVDNLTIMQNQGLYVLIVAQLKPVELLQHFASSFVTHT
jgi:hypothetical protein